MKKIISLLMLMLFFSSGIYAFSLKKISPVPLTEALKKTSPVPLAEALKTISEHYKVNFLYEEINVRDKTVEFNTKPLKEVKLTKVLDQLLSQVSLSWYAIDAKNYAIYPAKTQKAEKPAAPLHHQDTLATGKIKGRVQDQQQRPLQFSTVSLLHAKDSTVSASTLTDTSGVYGLSVIEAGSYLLRTDLMGYRPAYSKSFQLNRNEVLTVETILMEPYSKTLKEVKITAGKSLIEIKNDRLVMNVENSAFASGNSVQLLRSAPFVRVGSDNSVSLQGKKTMIMIDNRPVPENTVTFILQSLPAGNISKVELITSPSAKYDATYGAVINITTKKSEVEGLTGNINLDGSTGKYGQAVLNGMVTYKNKGLTIYGAAGETIEQNFFSNNAERILRAHETPEVLGYNWHRVSNNKITTFQGGAELAIGKNQTIGALAEGIIYDSKGPWPTINTFKKLGGPVDSILYTNANFNLDLSTYNYNLNYHLLADSGKNELSILGTYTPFQRKLFQSFPSQLNRPDGTAINTPQTYEMTNTTAINFYLGQVDYTHTFDKQLKLESGIKYQYVNSRSTIDYQLETNGQMHNVPEYSSNNKLKESIAGVYGILSKDWEKDKLQLGIRVENTQATFADNVSQEYFNIFPTLLYQHTINTQHNFSLSYKRTISRAPYNELVPYTVYSNKYTIEQGNPELKPEFDDIYTLSTNIKKLNIALSYTSAKNMSALLPTKQDYTTKVNYASRQNLDPSYDLSMYVYFSLRINSWWEIQNSGTPIGYNKVRGKVFNEPYSLSAFHSDFKSSHIFKLSEIMKLQVDAYYWTSYVQVLANFSGYKNVDAALMLDLFGGKGQFRIAGNQLIFKRNDFRQRNDFGNYSQRDMVNTDSKRVSIGFNYKFGKTKVKSPDKKLGNDESMKRL